MKVRGIRTLVAALYVSLGWNGALFARELKPSANVAAYYQSWSAEISASTGLDSKLADIPLGLTEVLLAFMRPDASYSGNLDLTGTGLEVPYSGSVLKASLEALRARIPGVRILVSIGGEEYSNWEKLNSDAIRRFVHDFDLDGVDLDFEPSSPNCRDRAGHMECESDATLLQVVKSLRDALPRPALLWLTATNTGAYGTGDWRTASPTGGQSYGLFVRLLRDPRSSAMLDSISIMAYDAGPTFRPLEAYAAYRSYYPGPILIGFTSPPEAWGGHEYSVEEVAGTIQDAMKLGAGGGMVWALGKPPPHRSSAPLPSVENILSALIEAAKSKQKDHVPSASR